MEDEITLKRNTGALFQVEILQSKEGGMGRKLSTGEGEIFSNLKLLNETIGERKNREKFGGKHHTKINIEN